MGWTHSEFAKGDYRAVHLGERLQLEVSVLVVESAF